MSSRSHELLGVVHPDGSLELTDALTVPPGQVRVRVESLEPPAPPAEGLMEFVERTRRELEAAGHRFLTSEEATAWIEELREDDERIAAAYRQTAEANRQAGPPE